MGGDSCPPIYLNSFKMNKKLSLEQQRDLISKYIAGYAITILAKIYSINCSTVCDYLEYHNIPRKRRGKIRNVQSIYIIKTYRQGKTMKAISDELKVSEITILNHLKKHHIQRRDRYYYRKYSINESYFDILDTPSKAYWLGFIMADGCVFINKKTKSHSLRIYIHKKDECLLTQFKNDLQSEHPIRYIKRHNQVALDIGSEKIVSKLISYGCIPHKSLILEYPLFLDPLLHSHFIRGYFDGDGCIHKTNQGNLLWKLSGTYNFLKKIQDLLMQHCNVRATKIIKDRNIFNLAYGGNKQTLRIRDYLYENADRFMERKFMKFNTFN